MPELKSPWDWYIPHKCIVENHVDSGYDLGIDKEGDVLIHFKGHVSTVSGETIAEIDGSDPEKV